MNPEEKTIPAVPVTEEPATTPAPEANPEEAPVETPAEVIPEETEEAVS